MKIRCLLQVASIFALPFACMAQGTKPGGGPPPNPGPTTTAPNPTPYLDRGWEDAFNKGRTGYHLRGAVTLTEGTLPWEPIPIVVSCQGVVSYSTTADPQGSFVIANMQPVGSSAIIGTQKSLVGQLVGCKVSAVLHGFDSSQLTIANRDLVTNPDIGTITLKREDGAEYAALSATTNSAPKEAKKAFEKARREWLEGHPERAKRDLEKAVEIDHRFAEAWYRLGKVQEASNSPGAWNSFSNAIAADHKFELPYEQMAALSAKAGRWQELTEETSEALERHSRGTLDLWYYNAIGNYQMKRLEIAKASAAKSLAMDPLHVRPDTEQLLAIILVALHDEPAALEHLRNCLTYFPAGPNYDLVKRQIEQLEASGTVATEKPVAGAGATQLEILNLPHSPERSSAALNNKSIATGAVPSVADRRWAPPEVEENTPTVESGTPCNQAEVLQKVGQRVEEFVDNVERFTATESLVQETMNRSGEVSGKESRTYDYMVSIREIRPGMLNVEESLVQGVHPADSAGGITTKGLPALLLIFHPSDSDSFSMRCEGQVSLNGRPTWQIYFRQRADKPNTTRSYNFGPSRPSYGVAWKGRAWFTADTYQIVRLQADLVDTIPEIQLTVDHADVAYGPVHFKSKNEDMWLPQTAELFSDLKGRRVHQRMSFGNYTLFSVDEKQKIAAPKSDP